MDEIAPLHVVAIHVERLFDGRKVVVYEVGQVGVLLLAGEGLVEIGRALTSFFVDPQVDERRFVDLERVESQQGTQVAGERARIGGRGQAGRACRQIQDSGRFDGGRQRRRLRLRRRRLR